MVGKRHICYMWMAQIRSKIAHIGYDIQFMKIGIMPMDGHATGHVKLDQHEYVNIRCALDRAL